MKGVAATQDLEYERSTGASDKGGLATDTRLTMAAMAIVDPRNWRIHALDVGAELSLEGRTELFSKSHDDDQHSPRPRPFVFKVCPSEHACVDTDRLKVIAHRETFGSETC